MQTKLMVHYFGVDSLVEPTIVEKYTTHHFDRFDDKIVLLHNFLQ